MSESLTAEERIRRQLLPENGSTWTEKVLVEFRAEAAAQAEDSLDVLRELRAQAGVIASSPSYERLLRWIDARLAAEKPHD